MAVCRQYPLSYLASVIQPYGRYKSLLNSAGQTPLLRSEMRLYQGDLVIKIEDFVPIPSWVSPTSGFESGQRK